MKTTAELKVIFGKMREAYFFKNAPSSLSNATNLIDSADFEMPLSEDGVNFEPVGSPTINRKKLTNGETWYTSADKGDSNVSMQVPSFHEDLNNLFMKKVTSTRTSIKLGSDVFSGNGYSLEPKKFSGMWLFLNPEHDLAVILPNTENYANMVGAKGNEMGYYNVATTPLSHKTYGEILILENTSNSLVLGTEEVTVKKSGTVKVESYPATGVTWESMDTTTATVSDGTITGVKAGVTGIKATYNGVTKVIHVTVTA